MSTRERQTWRPTRTSRRIVAAVTLAVIGLLLAAVPKMVGPTLIGVVGAGCLTGSVWLVGQNSRDSLTTFVASVLVVPAAVGLIGAAVVATLLVTGNQFPVPDARFVSVSTLIVLGNVGVTVGCVLAVLGVALGTHNVLDDETLTDFVSVGVLTGLVPMGATTLYTLRAFLSDSAPGEPRTPDLHLSTVLSPGTTHLHLADFLLVCATAAGLLAAAIRVLPVAELLGDTGGGETQSEGVRKSYYGLVGVTAVTAFLGLVLLPLELLLDPERFRSFLGDGFFEFVRGVTTAGPLRVVLLLVAGASVLGLIGGGVARLVSSDDRWATSPGEEESTLNRTGPLVASAIITFVAVAVAESVFETVVDGTASRLPDVLAADLQEAAAQSASVYGEATFAVLLTTVLIAATVALALGLRIAITVGYLSGETTGYSLASAGLFVGVAFAATIEVSHWLVFGGVAASLLVWDAGRFGTVLGKEIGSVAETRSTTFVHTGATALVGVVGVLIAAGARSQFQGGIVQESPVTIVALLAVVIGTLSFAAALR